LLLCELFFCCLCSLLVCVHNSCMFCGFMSTFTILFVLDKDWYLFRIHKYYKYTCGDFYPLLTPPSNSCVILGLSLPKEPHGFLKLSFRAL
jgi:hypothetical protein